MKNKTGIFNKVGFDFVKTRCRGKLLFVKNGCTFFLMTKSNFYLHEDKNLIYDIVIMEKMVLIIFTQNKK